MRIQVFGHPFVSIGMGEQMVSFCRAMDEVYLEYRYYNIWDGQGSAKVDRENRRKMSDRQTDDCNWGDLRIFHINGDEIGECLRHLAQRGFDFSASKNIIIPAWELPDYPEKWQESVNMFDEIWALSGFIEKIFSSSWVRAKVRYVGQAAERESGICYPRKFFSIRDSALVFLSLFDQSSYVSRKNPFAALELYKRLRSLYPFSDFQLVLKCKNLEKESDIEFPFMDEHVVLINQNIDYDQMTSLLDCCDVFVSLHRSEGFGRGGAEAVLRGKRALLTGYSGVEDYIHDKAVIPVKYSLVEVGTNQYPGGEGQQWAEPDLDDALKSASQLILDREHGFDNRQFYEKNREAGKVVRQVASNFAVGLNILHNLGLTRNH